MCSDDAHLVTLVRGFFEAANRGELDDGLRFYSPDATFDMSHVGLGTYEGREAIRRFWSDWLGAYEDSRIQVEDVIDLGHGVVVAVFGQDARPAGSSRLARMRTTWVYEWVDGMIVRVTNYPDARQGLAAAERLAEARA
jgi:ketosteroid isomerase-like protein